MLHVALAPLTQTFLISGLVVSVLATCGRLRFDYRSGQFKDKKFGIHSFPT